MAARCRAMRVGSGSPVFHWRATRVRTLGSRRKLSRSCEGISAKSVGQRVPTRRFNQCYSTLYSNIMLPSTPNPRATLYPLLETQTRAASNAQRFWREAKRDCGARGGENERRRRTGDVLVARAPEHRVHRVPELVEHVG